jgi:peptidyl-prolyl cis-trans isomerase D
MLKSMRKNLKSLAPALWFVIAAFIISIFAVWGGAGRLGESRNANTILTIGKEKIGAEVYFQTLRQRLEQMKQEFKSLDKNFIQQLNIPQQVLEQMIQRSVLIQAGKSMGIYATPEEIRNKLVSYPVFQRDGKFVGFDEYARILSLNRIKISDFEEGLKEEIVLEKVVKVLTAGVTVSEEEIWENYKNTKESAKMEYVILETSKIELTEEPQPSELQEYFEKNRESFKIPEKREADYVYFVTEDFKDSSSLQESEIEKYYNENETQFTEPEKTEVSRIYLPFEGKEKELVNSEAKSILDKIQAGEDFGQAAKTYSKDEKAQDNGNWGLYEWKRLSPTEQQEINKLSAGSVSGTVELEDGVSILKVTKKEASYLKPLAEVKERITNILLDQKARAVVDERIQQLEKAAEKETNLAVAAQKLGYPIKNTGLLKEGEAITDIDPSGSISLALFKLSEKGLSSPLYTYKGVGLAQLKKIEPPRQANLEDVETEVKEKFTEEKKKRTALERMKKVKAEIPNKGLEKLAEEYELEYKTIEEHKRGQYLSFIGENSEVDKLAFSLPLNTASDPIEFETGVALIYPQARTEVTREDFEKEQDTEKESLLETKRNKFFSSYMNKLRDRIGVKIKYDLYLQVSQDVLSRFTGEEKP